MDPKSAAIQELLDFASAMEAEQVNAWQQRKNAPKKEDVKPDGDNPV